MKKLRLPDMLRDTSSFVSSGRQRFSCFQLSERGDLTELEVVHRTAAGPEIELKHQSTFLLFTQ
jgi:hypothetical protein